MTDSSDNHISLLIPGLFGPTREQITEMAQAYRAPKTPSLGRMLARADVIADPGRTAPRADSFHERLFGLFDLLPETPVDLPVAAVTHLADGGVINADWRMRADPVSLLPQGGG